MIDPSRPDYANTPASHRRARFAYAPADPSAPPLVAIVTPFHNTGAVFHETARCVLGQSLQQWEWIIVNDGTSVPEALAVLDGYRQLDARIQILDLPHNVGLSAARNRGFAAARAPYVMQVDSDDLIEPTAVEKCWWFLESHPEYAFVKGYTVGFGAQEYLATSGFHDRTLFLEQNPVAATAMIRVAVHAAVGGYDQQNRGGLEDWEFWLACAHAGYWGATIPEHFDWYRRRADQSQTWSNWDGGRAQSDFLVRMRKRYAALWEGGFPAVASAHHMPNAALPTHIPGDNRLTKAGRRLLLICPWLTVGGADKFNLDLVTQLKAQGWDITIATTVAGDHSWLPQFTRVTPDVFALHRFLPLLDHPRFLEYLIGSRQPDVVLVTNSELGYMLLPYLRACAPHATFVDYTHMEEEHWKSGGFPRLSVEYQHCLDANITLSDHLKGWMVTRGGDPDRTIVAHTGVALPPAEVLSARRAAGRRRLGVAADVPVILYAGRLCPQKQPQVFAETMRHVSAATTNYVAIVAGNGPDFSVLSDAIARYGLGDTVRMVGAVPPEEMSELMAAADVFFLPSQWEGIALTILEAMANGVAVVGAAVGGQRELVTPECGVLIEKDGGADVEASRYAAVLGGLLVDPDRRAEMGRRSRARMEARFQLEHMMQRMLDAFDRAADLQANSPRAVPHEAFAHVAASRAIEYTRLYHLADDLWIRQLAGGATPAAPSASGLRGHILRACSLLEPAYAWGVRNGWTWLPAVRQRLRGAVLGA